MNLETICGVKLISGTKSIALFPCSNNEDITFIYTSVFPLPVTPYKSIFLLSLAFNISLTALS